MDSETIFWIAIVFVYFIFQMFGRKRTQERPSAQPKRRTEPPSEELDDALREIRRALGWPEEQASEPVQTRVPEPLQTKAPESVRTRPPQPVQRRAPERVQTREPRPVQMRPPSPVRPLPPRSFEEAAFRFEEAFEKSGAALSVPDQKAPAMTVKKPRANVPTIVSRLRDAKTLRQEFLIKEILDRPLVLRRHR